MGVSRRNRSIYVNHAANNLYLVKLLIISSYYRTVFQVFLDVQVAVYETKINIILSYFPDISALPLLLKTIKLLIFLLFVKIFHYFPKILHIPFTNIEFSRNRLIIILPLVNF